MSVFFDAGAELAKSVVRELFTVQAWAVDGASAAILHLTQSSKLNNYMAQRRRRLASPTKTEKQNSGEPQTIVPAKDKFLSLYLNKKVVAAQKLIRPKHYQPHKKKMSQQQQQLRKTNFREDAHQEVGLG